MLCADVAVAETSCNRDRRFNDIFASRCEIVRRKNCRSADADAVSDSGLDIIRRDVSCREGSVCDASLA